MKTNLRTPARHVYSESGDPRNPTVTYANQSAIREAFWQAHPHLKRRGANVRQNAYPCDTRCAFVDFVDMLAKDGEISASLAQRVTL